MTLITDPDNPTGNNPDAVVVGGERLDPDDVSVENDTYDDDSDSDLDDDDGTPDADPDDDDDNQDSGNFKARYGDAVRYSQQQKQRADALQARLDNLKREGVDIDEIEKLLPNYGQQQQQSVLQQNVASKQDLAQVAQNMQWHMARNAFMMDNPDFRSDADMSEDLEFQAAKVIRQNIAQNGVLTLAPDKVYKKAAKAVKARVKNLENKGKKKANQTREKVKSQGSDMGGNTGKRSKGKAEEEQPFDPRKAYMGLNKL